MTDQQCEKRVYSGFGFGAHQCTRRGVIEEQGRLWCRQHAPSAKEARDEERRRKHEARWAKREHAGERARLRDAVADAAMAAWRAEQVATTDWASVDEMAATEEARDEACAALDAHEREGNDDGN